MQPILVATDFSAAARNALRFAARLAAFRNCPLRVVHAYTWPISTGDPLLLPASLETIGRDADEGLASLEEELRGEFPGVEARFEKIHSGDIAYGIARYCNELQPFLLVLGTHERPGAESWFSHGLRLVHKSPVPLLMVPSGFSGTGWMRAVLAYDGNELQPPRRALISTLMGELHALLNVVHVQTSAKEAPAFPDLGTVGGGNHRVLAEDVATGLRDYLRQHPTDLLVLLPHHHSFWERLFGRPHTPALVSNLQLPLLLLPED